MRKKEKQYFSVALNLKGEPVKIIGGGKVAERKILTLLETGAHIYVISPELSPRLAGLFRKNKLVWLRRLVRKQDLSGAKIIIAATDDQKTNKDISKWAKEMNILVNIVDNPKLSSFISPAILHKDKAAIAIHTNGNDPVFSRDLKNFLKEHWNGFLSYRDRL
ncbi:MAG: bifunctional precorrin-2 dehydrogenase/sirohydrochlorin ferrochelatase [Candidatus Omnitrophica bacterium]|nr:bifunctional precorrin-2 dehydrogenase/sirohydrochlorin ferrochelatase [Candidatus Omnitrophota bacterium]